MFCTITKIAHSIQISVFTSSTYFWQGSQRGNHEAIQNHRGLPVSPTPGGTARHCDQPRRLSFGAITKAKNFNSLPPAHRFTRHLCSLLNPDSFLSSRVNWQGILTMATTVDAKLLKQTKFPPEFSRKVDMTKVNIEVMKK